MGRLRGAGPGYSSRLASPAFVVPGAEENPRLRFWHWYSFNVGPDYGEVQIRMGTNAWQALAHYEGHGSGVWSRPALDLSVYAGQSVQVGFVFAAADGNHWYGNVDAGWYVDEVEVVTGSIAPLVADVPESFEGGLGDWYVDAGVWEVGVPTYGPLPNALGWRAHGGTNCAGTVLGNTYRDNSDSRLISPVFAVPSAEQNPRLRFWSWVQTYGPGDYGRVLIRTEGGVWQTLSEEDFTGPGAVWNQAVLDLSGYGGQLVELAWLFHSDASTVAAGWYVDEVTLVTGPVQAVGAQVVESFESGWGDWSVQGGGPWELGEPTSGPGSAHGGTNCVGTALGGNYPEWDVYAGAGPGYSSRLASPAFVVPGAEENPRLRFWHWYSFNVGPDYGEVQIRMGTNAWQALAHYEGHGSGVWSRPALDLSVYAGQSVQVGFVFAAADGNHWYGNVDAGWYVDEVGIYTPGRSPDLVVSTITAPDNAVSGVPLQISWVVTNQGNGAVRGTWKDTSCLRTPHRERVHPALRRLHIRVKSPLANRLFALKPS